MVEKLKEVFSLFTFLSPKDLLELASVFKFKKLKKGEHFGIEGEYNYYAGKVITGLLSHYVFDENGIEKTLLFVPEGMNTGSLLTLFKGLPADENIKALEDTLLICVDVREIEKLADNNLRILKLMNENYKQTISEAAERIKFLVVHTPEERYLNFCKKYPSLEKRVKQKDLASYLCVTDTSLSRIKARLAQ